ncbi:Na+/H+ antiporter [Halotalea alkalilenta]|uniref:Na+/H+ antiporter n=1 Tax=Halotalea alkalilenta TaxID=376489 RepID=UPI00048694F5|nr:Na+/H+ antiporter [Halotalea alkalilenta]
METVSLVLILLFVASATGVAARFLPSLPTPLVQVAFGAALAWPAEGIHVSLEPELFLLLFIAPLLYSDARRFPQRELMALRGPILALAFGLVLFTVLGVGYLIHWMLPVISLPIAFALAAVLSPTDAVAVSAISGRLPVPPKLMRVLEGESLMNDASGLVAFKFAVAAALTGAFSLSEVSTSFLFIAFGGLLLGGACAWLFSVVRTRLIDRHGGEQSATQIVLLQLLMPFAVYFLAEHFGMSGILAAVAAGLVVNYTDLKRQDQIQTRLKTRSMWEIIEFVLNSLVFLLLGFQLPDIIGGAFSHSIHDGSQFELLRLCAYVFIITTALMVLRFIWVFGALWTSRLAARIRQRKVQPFPARLMLVTTISGIRGTITLAAALSFPQTMLDGTPFPGRELLVFIATGVILLTLLSGSIGLPLLLKDLDLPPDTRLDEEEARARKRASEAAIRRVEEYRHARVEALTAEHSDTNGAADAGSPAEPMEKDDRILIYAEQSTQLMNLYRERVTIDDTESASKRAEYERKVWRELLQQALQAERAEYYRLRSRNRINDDLLRKLVREVDLSETALIAGQEESGGGHH